MIIINSNNEEHIRVLKDELKKDIYNEKIYFDIGKCYEELNENDNAYLWYEASLQFCKDECKIKKIQEHLSKIKINIRNFSIVIITYNNLQYTKQCIESILSNNNLRNYEIIIVDNNSIDGTRQWLSENKNLKYILNDKNEGFVKGCNIGINAAIKDNDIFLLNNDTVVMINSILNLRLALYSEKDVGITGAVTNYASNFQQVEQYPSRVKNYFEYAEYNNVSESNTYEKRIRLIGFAMMIKREVIEKIGLLDERFSPGNFEDDDYSFRAIKSGYKLLLCKDSFIYHYGSQSFKNQNFNEILVKNKMKFINKWGINSFYSTYIRNDLIKLITFSKDKKINVLEIGCACGATLLKIESIYKNSHVYGIDINEKVIGISKNIIDSYCLDIEEDELPFNEEYFDVILLPDVIEHLKNPWKVLKKLKKYLNSDGEIIASIPNIMHISVINNLLKGFWSYEEAGLLDKTHLRFFTLNEIVKLFNYAGFNEIFTLSNYIHISNEEENKVKEFAKVYGIDENQYRTYQYLITNKKTNHYI